MAKKNPFPKSALPFKKKLSGKPMSDEAAGSALGKAAGKPKKKSLPPWLKGSSGMPSAGM